MRERLPYACGGIVVAGLMYLVLAAHYQDWWACTA